MSITKIPKLGKAVSAWFRNRASKKLFKEASGGLQHPVIKSFKPTVIKTKLDKAKSNLAIATQKAKASGAKVKQTVFEISQKAKGK